MNSTSPNSFPPIGFLTIVESPTQGIFGGYLVLNDAGRPLEFHCTAPVRPNRAQKILYGPTLKPYLYGEQIGKTLLSQAKNTPHTIYTDVAEVMAVRAFTSYPIVLLLPSEVPNETAGSDVPLARDCRLIIFCELNQRFAVSAMHEADGRRAEEQFAALGDTFDFTEPFERIRFAIEEAQAA